ncbi:MAG: transposase [Halioglobus sp.]
MSRPLRIEFEGALYHITARGNERKSIFRSSNDRERFLEMLAYSCERYQWLCHAYCLMGNHYHVVIETPLGNLSKGVAYLNGCYSQYFNGAHRRVGHVFQGRYKSILIEKQSYLLELSRYVVLNPVRASMVRRPQEWPWSSYRGTAGVSKPHDCLTAEWILSHFSGRKSEACQWYRKFVLEGRGLPAPWVQLKHQIYLGSDQFVEDALNNISDEQEIGEVPRVQKTAIAKPLAYYRDNYSDENTAIAMAYGSGDFTLEAVGVFFGKGRSTVSRKVRAYEKNGKWET